MHRICVLVFIVLCNSISVSQWTHIVIPLAGSAVSSIAADGSTVIVGTFSSGVFLSTDNGTNWTRSLVGLPGYPEAFYPVRAVAVSGQNCYAGWDGGLYRSTDRGATWQSVNSITGVLSLAANLDYVWAGTLGTAVYFSSDRGANWGDMAHSRGGPVTTLAPTRDDWAAGTWLFFAGSQGLECRNWFGGFRTDWEGIIYPALLDKKVYSVVGVGDYGLGPNIFVGTNAGMYRSTIGSASWVPTGPANVLVQSLASSSTRKVFALSTDGLLFFSADMGQTWTDVTVGPGAIGPIGSSSVAASGSYIFCPCGNGLWRRLLLQFVLGMRPVPLPPDLSSPADGTINTPIAPTLVWNVSTGATSYRLQVSSRLDFSTTIYNQDILIGTSQTINGLEYSTKYYWRVNATNSAGTSTWYQVWNFTTSAPPFLTILTPSPLPQGTMGVDCSLTLTATGGAQPYTWSLSEGSIPSGLNLTPWGTLAGVPLNSGTFSLKVSVTDNTMAQASKTFTMVVSSRPTGTLALNVLPADAIVTIVKGNRVLMTRGDIATINLPEGKYVVSASKKWWVTKADTILVQANVSTPVVISLQPMVTLPASNRKVSPWLFEQPDATYAETCASMQLLTTICPCIYLLNIDLRDGSIENRPFANYAATIRACQSKQILVVPLIGILDPATGAPNANNTIKAVFDSYVISSRNIQSIVDSVIVNGYDGIDVDYEAFGSYGFPQPGGGLKWDWYAKAMTSRYFQSLSDSLARKGKLCFVTVGATGDDAYTPFDFKKLAQISDRLRVMCYDMGAPNHAALHEKLNGAWLNISDALDYVVSKVPDKSKIVLGFPTYGKAKDMTDSKRDPVALVYRDVQDILASRSSDKKLIDKTHSVDVNSGNIPCFRYRDLANHEWLACYEDEGSIGKKLDYLLTEGIREVAFWRFGETDFLSNRLADFVAGMYYQPWGRVVRTFCPVDLVVTDPSKRSISKQQSSIPGATYEEFIVDSLGNKNDVVNIPYPIAGQYTIKVVAEPGAQSSDNFTLTTSQAGETIVIAENSSVGSIPVEPFAVSNTLVAASSVIGVLTDTISFEATMGGPISASKNLTITNDGSATLHWSATQKPSWLAVTPTSAASNSQVITIQPDSTNLSPGTYLGAMTISDPAAMNNPQAIPIKYIVAALQSPTLGTPTDTAMNVSIIAALKWSRSVAATRYWLQISTSAAFSTTIVNDSTITDTTMTVGPMQNNVTYYWRVSAKNDGGTSPWSQVRSFTTIVAAPQAPTLAGPVDSAKNLSTTPTVSWTKVGGAVTYCLQVSVKSIFLTLVVNDSTVIDTTKAIGPLQNNTTYCWRVNAKNEAGASGWSLVRSFTTIVAAPQTPTLAGLVDTARNVSITPTLGWAKMAGATTYRLQVSPGSAFSTTVVNDSTITDTTKTIGPLQNNATYYWRVSAKNEGGTSGWSLVRSFTTIVAAPQAPTLAGPADTARNVSITPTLSWAKATGAVIYRLQVSLNSTFLAPIVNDSTVTDTTRAVGPLQNAAMYYWRVNAKNEGGTSPWSSVRSFTTIVAAPQTPTLAGPADTARNVSITPTLSWAKATGAVTYRLQVSLSSAFSATVVNDSTITDTTKTIGPLQNNVTYYWRVSAKNDGGTSSWSLARSFTTIVTAPQPPSLVGPVDNSRNVSITPSLSWAKSTCTTAYRLQISLSSTFSTTIVNDSTITDTTKTIGPLQNNTAYYWRVSAKNDGGTSAWSLVRSFTTIVAAPKAPALAGPVDTAKNVSITPTLSWAKATGAVTYCLQVSPSLGFSTTVVDDSTIADTTKTIGPLQNNVTYYWRVSAKNDGGTSAWSLVRSFTTIVATPTAPSLVAPADSAINVQLNTLVSWNAVSGATLFHLQVSTAAIFASLFLDDSTLSESSRSISKLSLATTYFWRVRAKNEAGWGAFSSARRFSTIRTTSVEQVGNAIPSEYGLSQNYPNPFNPSTIIQFALPKRSQVSLKVFDLLGREVVNLVSQDLGPGYYSVRWQAGVPSGTYIYRLQAGEFVESKKMILLH